MDLDVVFVISGVPYTATLDDEYRKFFMKNKLISFFYP